jgi:hypothetical protein
MAIEQFSNNARTTLNGALSNVAVSPGRHERVGVTGHAAGPLTLEICVHKAL